MPYLLTPYDYHANNVLTVTPFSPSEQFSKYQTIFIINKPSVEKNPLFVYKLFTHSKAWGAWAPSIRCH